MKVRLDFMLFCGLELHSDVPDETTHCRFRTALVKGGFTTTCWLKFAASLRITG